MAKTKSMEVAASDVPSDLEETTGNVAESAPPMLINTREETTMVVDIAEEDAKEESKENEKVDSVGTDVPEGEKVDEGDKTLEVKATGEVKGDETGKSTSKKKGKVLRKRKTKAVINAAVSSEKKEASASAAAPNEKTTMVVDTAEEDAKEESKENEKVDSVGTDVPEGEEVDGGDKTLEVKATEEVKGDEKGKSTSKRKGKVLRKRKTKAVINAAASSEKKGASASAAASNEKTKEASASAGVSDEKPKEKPNGTDQPETPTVDMKKLKMADGMGLIFMCNSKTKKDCFHYKVLGLPASKKEMVEKVYKGMRLFLFDVDLKLMYGIYKAASPGGYNLEPKAFKSAFPSQVRFTVLDDCLPLPEEKFKAAIKENYYGRNKFNCQLSVEQQRNLCKLFKRAGKASSSGKKSREAIRAEPGPRSADRGRKRRSRAEAEPSYANRDRKRSRAEPEPSSADWDRKRRALQERERANRVPPRIRGRDFYSRREAYASPPPRRAAYASPPSRPVAYGSPPRMVARLPPLPPPSYGYDRPVDDYYYRREPLQSAEPRDHRIMNVVDTRAREPIEHRNLYALYREPPLYREASYAPASLPSMPYAPHSYPPY